MAARAAGSAGPSAQRIATGAVAVARVRLRAPPDKNMRRLLADRFLDLHHEVLVLAAGGQLRSFGLGGLLLRKIEQGDPLGRLIEHAPEQFAALGLGRLAAALALDRGLFLRL